jgi:predicted ArsR family transcriptional regulator
MDQLEYLDDDDLVHLGVRRLVYVTIEQGAIDGWTVAALTARLGLPTLPVRQALDDLIARGLVAFEQGEYRSTDVA